MRKHRNETRHIVNAMKARNVPIIQQWKEAVATWAQMHRTDANAAAVNAWLPFWQPRPFYTAKELAPLWPALAIVTGFTKHWPAVLKSPRRLEFELDFYGLPRVRLVPDYFICERIRHWLAATDEEIAREIENAQR